MKRYFVHIYMLFHLLLLFGSCLGGRVCDGCSRPTVIAHRGGASFAPENSLSAIAAALALGVDAVEVDVRLSVDGRVVLMHDERVDRTTDGWGRVCDMSSDVLSSLRLRGADGVLTPERVPLLDDVLALVNGRCFVLIDVKCASGGVERAVLDAVERYDAAEWVAVQSFNDAVLERFNALEAPFPLEKLFVFKFPLLPFIFDSGVSYFSMDKYSYISSFNISRHFARRGLVEKIRRAGKSVKLWTFGQGKVFLNLPVDGVITDFPQSW